MSFSYNQTVWRKHQRYEKIPININLVSLSLTIPYQSQNRLLILTKNNDIRHNWRKILTVLKTHFLCKYGVVYEIRKCFIYYVHYCNKFYIILYNYFVWNFSSIRTVWTKNNKQITNQPFMVTAYSITVSACVNIFIRSFPFFYFLSVPYLLLYIDSRRLNNLENFCKIRTNSERFQRFKLNEAI